MCLYPFVSEHVHLKTDQARYVKFNRKPLEPIFTFLFNFGIFDRGVP